VETLTPSKSWASNNTVAVISAASLFAEDAEVQSVMFNRPAK